jgi:xanthine dehydrogenase YagR molybdenum-binding subunit
MNRAAPEPRANMGKPEPRIEARIKVTGEARFGSDFPASNAAHAFLVTSSIAKGSIASMDLTAARAVPGVLDIFTHENTGELKPIKYSAGGGGPSTSIQDFGPKIQHDGQIVAMVVADTFEAAREAAFRIEIKYDAQAPSAGFDSEETTREDVSKGATPKKLPQAGDADTAFDAADVKFEGEYGTAAQHHNAIELFTTTCSWRDKELTIHEPSQFVYGLKCGVATALDVDPANVHVVSPFVGGAFGSKAQVTPRTALVALAAKKLNRPVKLVMTRDQGFTVTTYRAETRHKIRMGAQKDGKITAFIHEGAEVTSRPDPYSVAGVEDSARLYTFGAVKTHVDIVHADRNTPGFMRSPPVVPYIYALESAMDELAEKLGMDPIELRRVNDSMKDATGKEWSSRSLMKCYDEAAAQFGWSKRQANPGSMRDGDWLVGYGCASAVYPTHVGASTARVQLFSDGKAKVLIAAHEIGTGVRTVVAQIAAERLGIKVADITVETGDSALPPSPVAGGSNQTASCCNVVMKACDAIKAKLKGPAQTQGSGSVQEEKLEDTFKRLGVGAIEEYAEFLPPGGKPDTIKKLYGGTPFLGGGSKGEKLMYALGAEFVEVRVHARTREIRVPRMVGAFAAGRLMNTRTARSQYLGGMIWGLSSALHEATEIDPRNARYVNDNLADYMIPVNADVPGVEIILVPEEDSMVNPLGIKGIGELANVGTAAAVANAVYHATGIRVRELPIRLEKLLA